MWVLVENTFVDYIKYLGCMYNIALAEGIIYFSLEMKNSLCPFDVTKDVSPVKEMEMK